MESAMKITRTVLSAVCCVVGLAIAMLIAVYMSAAEAGVSGAPRI